MLQYEDMWDLNKDAFPFFVVETLVFSEEQQDKNLCGSFVFSAALRRAEEDLNCLLIDYCWPAEDGNLEAEICSSSSLHYCAWCIDFILLDYKELV